MSQYSPCRESIEKMLTSVDRRQKKTEMDTIGQSSKDKEEDENDLLAVNPRGGGMSSAFIMKRKREFTSTTEGYEEEHSNTGEKEEKTSEDSVVSPGESDFDRLLREHEEHLQRVDNSPELWDMHLTFDEFCMQEEIDEDEFGPDEDIYSIRRDCLDLGLPKKYMEREWRMRANRFKEVQRLKRRKQEEATTTAAEQSGE